MTTDQAPAAYPLDWKARKQAGWPEAEIGLPELTPARRLRRADVDEAPEFVRLRWCKRHRLRPKRGPVLRTALCAGSDDDWITLAPSVLGNRDEDAEVVLRPASKAKWQVSRIWASRWTTAATLATTFGAVLFGLNATEIDYLDAKPVAFLAAALLLLGTGCAFAGWFQSEDR